MLSVVKEPLTAVSEPVTGGAAERLMGLLSTDFLVQIEWHAGEQTFSMRAEHRWLGWALCAVTGCAREGQGAVKLCNPCRQRLTRHPQPLVQFLAAPSGHPDRGMLAERVSLRGLPALVIAELLYAIQERCRAGVRTRRIPLRALLKALFKQPVSSITEPISGLPKYTREMVVTLRRSVEAAILQPDLERHKDVWNMGAFGLKGLLRFTVISQPWLREASKQWAFDYLPRHRGSGLTGRVQDRVNAVAQLSERLRLQRDDSGEVIQVLGAGDITAFCNRMAFLAQTSVMTEQTRLVTCRMVKLVLETIRTLGLTRAGQCAAGLPEDFTLRVGMVPDMPEDDSARDLPAEVMREVCARLDVLEAAAGVEARVAVELLIDTGRRPSEICALPIGCLDRDRDGSPVLVYDNAKAQRLGRRLPIPGATAELITVQQSRVRQLFPKTSESELTLLPAHRSADGRKSIRGHRLSERHREWVSTFEPIPLVHDTTIDGAVVAIRSAFDMNQATLYSYRHSYAQRHADAGVPVDVLRELMDHLRMDTTQRYYRVGDIRRRKAVEQVSAMQFDRHGTRIWRTVQALADDERLRQAVGEVAVPYGGCSEPSNVAAAGTDCPIRFRCVGCGHFRTDASYLPDLQAYLGDLLRNRERLLATSINADAWATTESMPSHEEISRVRALIDRIRGELDELSADERAEIEQAVALVRRGRINLRLTPVPRDLRPERDQ